MGSDKFVSRTGSITTILLEEGLALWLRWQILRRRQDNPPATTIGTMINEQLMQRQPCLEQTTRRVSNAEYNLQSNLTNLLEIGWLFRCPSFRMVHHHDQQERRQWRTTMTRGPEGMGRIEFSNLMNQYGIEDVQTLVTKVVGEIGPLATPQHIEINPY